MSNTPRSDYDSPWKDIIEFFFPQFMAFFVPGSQEDIDWNSKINFLDKELQKVTKESTVGKRQTDKLIEVKLKDGIRKWILIHVEVQSQRQSDFSERMFVYNYRIYDRYKIPVTSLAILADDSHSWIPEPFRYGMWGSQMGLDYLKVKLSDYRWNDLMSEDNPFAIVAMAHIKALETRKDQSLRKQWKTELTKLLYGKGYSESEILNLYRFIDWVLTLPEGLEKLYLEDIKEYERGKNMPYISNAEKIGRKEGHKEGHKEGGYKAVVAMIRNAEKQGLPVEVIAQIAQIDVESVKKILNNEQIDIPLHLLDEITK